MSEKRRKTDRNEKPFVSVIVPVYNAEDMIGDCIESLLAQDYPSDRYEIIIVDNDSTDDTADVIKRYPVKYVLEDQIHTSYAARNTGARNARGEALAFCDADQIAAERWLTNLLSHWHERDKYAGFCGPCPPKPVKSKPLMSRYWAEQNLGVTNLGPEDTQVDRWFTGNLCVRADRFWELAGFDPHCPSGGDGQFTRRLSRRSGSPLLYVGAAVQHHRIRLSCGSIVRQRFRIAYGAARKEAGDTGGVGARLVRQLAGTVWFWVRIPPLSARELIFRGEGDWRYTSFELLLGSVVKTSELAGYFAYHFRMPEKIVARF